MAEDQAEARAGSGRRPLEHLEVAVRVAEGEDGAAPYELLDPDGLSRLVVDEVDLREADDGRHPFLHAVLGRDRRPDDLLRRDAVDPLGEAPDHLDASAGDQVRLEPVRAQVREELEHRLVDGLGVGASEARVPGLSEPVGDGGRELVRRHPGVRRDEEVEEPLLAGGGEGLQVAGEHGRERRRRLPLRVLRCERLHSVEREGELDVHRLLGPEGPVVVEDGDALGLRHEARRVRGGDVADEGDDRPPGGRVVPARKRVDGPGPGDTGHEDGGEQECFQRGFHQGFLSRGSMGPHPPWTDG